MEPTWHMAETIPSAGSFSKLSWQKKLRGADLSHAEYRVLMTVSTYTGADGRNAYPGNAKIIEDSTIARSKIGPILKSLEVKGWLVVQKPSVGRTDATVYRLGVPADLREADAAGSGGQIESLARELVPSGNDDAPSGDELVPLGGLIRSLPNQRSDQLKTPSSATRPTPELLPEGWKPNGMHRFSAGRLGYTKQDLTDLEQRFRYSNRGKRSTNWDRDFGGLIRSHADDSARAEIDYELEPLEDSYV